MPLDRPLDRTVTVLSGLLLDPSVGVTGDPHVRGRRGSEDMVSTPSSPGRVPSILPMGYSTRWDIPSDGSQTNPTKRGATEPGSILTLDLVKSTEYEGLRGLCPVPRNTSDI